MRKETYEYLGKVCNSLTKVAEMIRFETNEVASSGNHVDIIKHFNSVRIGAELIKEAREAISEISDQLSREIVPDAMRRADVKTITVEGVGRVTVSYRFSCTMVDKGLGIDWLRKSGNGGIIQETVNSSTLSAFAKNMLEVEGKELPDDLFKVGTSPFTSITKVK